VLAPPAAFSKGRPALLPVLEEDEEVAVDAYPSSSSDGWVIDWSQRVFAITPNAMYECV
jgi:hypothetical protein